MTSAVTLWLIAGVGLINCFAGYRVFILALALVGAALGGYLGLMVAAQFASPVAGGIGLAAGAVLFALLAVFAYKAAVGVFGAFFFGAVAAVLLAPLTPLVQIPGALAAAGAGAWVATLLQRAVIVLATAVHGGLAAVLAVRLALNRGSLMEYETLFSRIVSGTASPVDALGGPVWVAFWVAIAAAGIVTQLRGPRQSGDQNPP